jgi:hypothetical protein
MRCMCESHLGPAKPTMPLWSYRCLAMSGGLEQCVEQDGCELSTNIDVERVVMSEVEHVQRSGAVSMPRENGQGHRRRAG